MADDDRERGPPHPNGRDRSGSGGTSRTDHPSSRGGDSVAFGAEQLAGALDVIAFLARSPGRVRVLETLAEGPHDRAALQEATGVPRTTVGRIVTNLHERGLITEQGRECRITPLGEMLIAEFTSPVRTAATVDTLRLL